MSLFDKVIGHPYLALELLPKEAKVAVAVGGLGVAVAGLGVAVTTLVAIRVGVASGCLVDVADGSLVGVLTAV